MMRKNLLGRTGFLVSEIAFGAGVTGGILIKGDETGAVRALNRALAAGINWIDTAALYGNGASEATIGRHINSLKPQPYVSTKVRIERDQMNDIPGAIERSLEREPQAAQPRAASRCSSCTTSSARRSATGRCSRPSRCCGPGGVADTFDRLKEQGLFYASGMTAAGETEAILEVIESGRFDCAQVYYNAINPSAGWSRAHRNWRAQDFSGIMAACFRQNMGVLNIRVFAGGPLAKPARPERLAVLTVRHRRRQRDALRGRGARGARRRPTARRRRSRCASCSATTTSRAASSASATCATSTRRSTAVEAGPLPTEAVDKLERLWATDFKMS